MFFRSFKSRQSLYHRVIFKNFIVMMICIRCVLHQKKYRLSFLLKNCVECIKFEKKCKFVVSMINFDVIDYVMIKLNREELKVETS